MIRGFILAGLLVSLVGCDGLVPDQNKREKIFMACLDKFSVTHTDISPNAKDIIKECGNQAYVMSFTKGKS